VNPATDETYSDAAYILSTGTGTSRCDESSNDGVYQVKVRTSEEGIDDLVCMCIISAIAKNLLLVASLLAPLFADSPLPNLQ